MGPKTKALMVAAIGVMAVYNVLERVEAHVSDLDVVRAELPSLDPAEVNPKAFYPVLVENLVGNQGEINALINEAFYTPPAPEESAAVKERAPISPINFLDQQRYRYKIQAIMPAQNMVIINGRSYGVGEALKTGVEATYEEYDGTVNNEMIFPHVIRIQDDAIWLEAEHSQGWLQSAQLSMQS